MEYEIPRDSQDPHYLVPHYPFRPKYRWNMALIVVGYQVVGVQGVPRRNGTWHEIRFLGGVSPRAYKNLMG